MILYGSTTSPYVRRIRLLLTEIEHEFVNLDIFSGPGRDILRAKNPTLKVPMLEDGELMIYDSRVIFRYLCKKFQQPSLTWEQENLLTLIDAANDSFVQLLILSRSNIEFDPEVLVFRLQSERLENLLWLLNEEVENGSFEDWDYLSISLYCLVDWVDFRELADLEAYPALVDFWHKHKNTINVEATDPRM
ncbi:glutathione S-transferase family protein [Glaciecola sp. 1036]|uniref:glutathione S-transferase family protein n=1 Tax=Alteromonadaceae TaxID=72275 RepID=UPI003CFF9AEC